MAFAAPTVNTITTDMCDLSIYLRSIKKFGKSTLFRDFIVEKFRDPSRGFHVSVGKEKGAKLLDGLNTSHLETYKDFMDMKKWLIAEKGRSHNIRVLCFDTADELFPIFEKEVVRKYNVEERPQKLCTSIKAAYGGFNRGVEMVADMVKDYMSEIMDAGFGVWVIAHTKYKNIKQKGDVTDGYMQLSSNLPANYEAVFGDIFDMTLTGIIDRKLETEEEQIAGRTVKKNYATDAVRKLYFRGTHLIDAGCRFSAGAVPEYMIFDAENNAPEFIRIIEDGMNKSKSMPEMNMRTAVKAREESKMVENADANMQYEDYQEEEVYEDLAAEAELGSDPDDLMGDDDLMFDKIEALNKIRSAFKVADAETKRQIKDIIAREGHSRLSEDMSVSVLKEMLKIVTP